MGRSVNELNTKALFQAPTQDQKDHLKQHLGVDVVHFQVDEPQEVLHLGLTQLVIFVLVGLPQAAQDPAEKFSV